MKTIKVRDKEFSISITAEEIQKTVSKIAEKINNDLQGKVPLFIVVLNGAFIFAADLFKKINIDCEVTFVKLSSYVGTETTSTVRELIGLDKAIKGRSVVIIEDIIDTGITMEYTIQKLKHFEAADVRIATLLFKPDAFQKDFKIDYIGMEIPNDFIVGYGLDYDGFARNYPDIYKIVGNQSVL
ncbi:MAG: hypoxanthine phosphoribosyltransferase [Bacteroidetes bacterium]|nr:hypoxanthine phosphoribosyltransferase [Bacteroidota bacterium]